MKLHELGEFGLINRLRRYAVVDPDQVVVGVGDDTAVLRAPSSKLMLLTTDTLIEHADFELDFCDFFSLGWKALAINLSDVAAMGGIPRAAVINLFLPPTLEVENVDKIYQGLQSIAEEYHLSLVGGDMTFSQQLGISIAVTGETCSERYVLRSGACVGDVIAVTGDLGAAAVGLRILQSGVETTERWEVYPVARFWRPQPRLHQAQVLQQKLSLHSLIDVSDGLASDMLKLCQASNVGCQLEVGKLPFHPHTDYWAGKLGIALEEVMLQGGEDFELLFTFPADEQKILADLNISVTVIGKIIPPQQGCWQVYKDGKKISLENRGYDHFRAQS